MAIEKDILEPIKEYPLLKEKVLKTAEKTIEGLAKEVKVDKMANRDTCDRLYKKQAELKEAEKKLNGKKGLRTFFIILIVILFIASAILIAVGISRNQGGQSAVGPILGAASCAIVAVILILITSMSLSKAVKRHQAIVDKLKKEEAEIHQEAEKQMAPFNAILDWGMPQKVISEAIPLLQLDQNFDVGRYAYLVSKYGLSETEDDDISVYHLQSGSIRGNPFLIERDYAKRMYMHTYTGSIVISWTVTVHNSDGSTSTQTRTQTLMASIERPAPSYHYVTFLVYGSEVAPKLNFSREPQVNKNASEKDLQKMVKQGTKAAEKKVKKSLMDDDPHDLTLMANTEFEVLWNALDRNDEAQYRLLFTPLAQQNILKLIKSKEPYGDDFSFYKDGKINTIMSGHSQNTDYYASPAAFSDIDFDKAKEKFLKFTGEFFQSVYFDLAPILSIPIYQQTKPAEFIYDHPYRSNVSFYEHEALANCFHPDLLKPADCATPLILKTEFVQKKGAFDQVEITAHGFRTVERTEFVHKMGGDGKMHTIPVPWTEYIPVKKKTMMEVANCPTTRHDYRETLCKNQGFVNFIEKFKASGKCHYERGLFAFLEAKESNPADLKGFASILGASEVKAPVQDAKKDVVDALKTMGKSLGEKAKTK